MTTRESLHELVDEIPESSFDDAEATLRRLASGRTSLRDFLESAPIDDEPLIGEEMAAIAEAEAELARGELVPHGVVKKLIANWPT